MKASPTPHPSRLDMESVTRRRRYALVAIFGIFLLFLFSLLFKLQILEYGIYGEKVLNQITVGSSLSAKRGEILDRNGNILATNRTVWRIYISPVDIKKAEKKGKENCAEMIARGLSEILSLSYDSILEKARKSAYLDQTISKSADEETVKRVLLFAKENGFSSMIHTEAGTERYYPFGTLAAHTLGFTGNDNQGLFGLEAYYNSIMGGTDGKYLASVDSQGIKLPNAYTDYIEAESGLTLVTTLDVYMQRELEHQLEQAMLSAGAQNRVTGIVMQVKTGDILAMATAPSFDLNDPYTLDEASAKKLADAALDPNSKEYKAQKNELLYGMWSNKAVSELYEPGSTFKIITVSAALETKAVTTSTGFHCPGYYMVGGCRISCHKHGGHGSLTLAEGLMHSCNPVMMQSAERMGSEAFYKYFSAFGYTKKTGIDLPGESMGLFHSPASLGSTELATASFGQRFKVSLIQQICAIATVANDGIPVTPHLLSSLQNDKKETVFTYRAEVKEAVISKKTAETVAEILECGVSGNGGAKNAYTEGYQVAAKTGTSEKFEILDANGRSFLRIGSCVAFAPYDDAEIAVIIAVDEPTCANKYGSMTAAPYISAYLSSVLPYLGLARSTDSQAVTVKDTVGMKKNEAKKMLESLGLSVDVIGSGDVVLRQTPSENVRLSPAYGRVILYTEDVIFERAVPNVKGKTLAEAIVSLTNAGFNIKVTGASQTAGIAHGATVVSQSLPPGMKTACGTTVEIQILHKNDTD